MINPTTIKTSKFRLSILGVFILILAGFIAPNSQTSIGKLKAVYLEKFSLFVTWPKESLIDDKEKPFKIAVYGDPAMCEILEQVYTSHKINNKEVKIIESSSIAQIEDVHIVYIGDISKSELEKILSFSNNKNILTISSSKGFAEKGVHINFFSQNNKLRFEINESAVLNSPLKISFYLMSSARIVNPVKDNK